MIKQDQSDQKKHEKKTGQLNSLEEGQSDFFWKYDNQLSIYFIEQIKGWSTI